MLDNHKYYIKLSYCLLKNNPYYFHKKHKRLRHSVPRVGGGVRRGDALCDMVTRYFVWLCGAFSRYAVWLCGAASRYAVWLCDVASRYAVWLCDVVTRYVMWFCGMRCYNAFVRRGLESNYGKTP
jgi:hypothetical protein